MITDEILLEANYRRYPPIKGNYNVAMFCKSVFIDGKRVYQLEVHKWHFPDGNESYEFEVRFYLSEDVGAGFYSIAYHAPTDTKLVNIADVEKWYSETFRRLDFIPDPYAS